MAVRSARAVDLSRAQPNAFAQQLFDGLPRRYDLLEAVLSFGQNHRWRTAMVDAVLPEAGPQPRRILDVATGTAGVALMLTERSDAEVVGIDLTEQMLRIGRERVAASDRADRIDLVCGRAEQLPFPDATFDALTFTYLLRYVADPGATLTELARVVRPGGAISSLEFYVPPPPVWLPLWRLYTRVVLPIGGFVGGGRAWATVGRFLGPSIEEHYRRYPVDAHVDLWPMSLGGGLVMWGRKPDG
jgi:demethylmenaquinone methyltransferase/2-methoxy-6-polyprenyl-1,4-benzoquinol methylase